ncbi:PhaM family polyhydroxyalkanoate granule multifunctional regulatory protein [Cupriavidus nantongensis]|uniref:PhaM family polyhydroxyalkanoate granule multifunctional regulatory protein n=1 Tax=Cupriavidus nantongensis TaxID=1796606 RepID=UPI0022475D02|nr:PhaM family polyhydroxyalkanoate granule multifunctional regulatory protein [Cupriavidus nantongensis]
MFGQIPDFSNGFDFMRRLWGGAGIPAGLMPGLQAMTPPMDLEDLDKRIADLKAVESWLQLNTNLLRTTIQGLEVQRATLVALQTFGNALSPEAMQSAMENVARAANAPSAEAPQRTGADTGAHAGTEPGNATQAEPPAAEQAQSAAGDTDAAPAPNAALWWDMLQQQFNQIASSAAAASMVPFGMGGMGGFGAAGAATPAGTAQSGAEKPKTAAAGKPPSAGTAGAAAKKAPAKKAPAKKAAARKPAKATPAREAEGGNGGNGGNGSSNGTGGSVTN